MFFVISFVGGRFFFLFDIKYWILKKRREFNVNEGKNKFEKKLFRIFRDNGKKFMIFIKVKNDFFYNIGY